MKYRSDRIPRIDQTSSTCLFLFRLVSCVNVLIERVLSQRKCDDAQTQQLEHQEKNPVVVVVSVICATMVVNPFPDGVGPEVPVDTARH